MIRVRVPNPLIVIALMAACPAMASASPMLATSYDGLQTPGPRGAGLAGPASLVQSVRFVARRPVDPTTDEDTSVVDPRYPVRGDKSGYPGGNEFDPTAPFGGQAAVTAQPGTPGYDEQMNQRRYFCEYASNRC